MKKSTFLILCLEGIVLSFNVAATSAIIPSIARDFGVSQFLAGKIIVLYMVPYGLAALLYGPLTRTFQARNIKLIGLGFYSLSSIVASLAANIYILFVFRFLTAVFGACIIPLALILISQNADKDERGKLVGLFFSTTFISSLLGLFFSGIINWRLLFLLPGFAGLLTLIYMYFCFPAIGRKQKSLEFNYIVALRKREVINVFIYIFCISLFYHGVQQWMGVFFSQNYQYSQFLISMLLTTISLCGIFGEAGGGFLSDKLGRIKVINLGMILMIISLFLLGLRSPLPILFILMGMWGLGWTFNHASVSAKLSDLPKDFVPESASLNSSVRFFSGGLGAGVGSLIMQKSFNLGFMVFGICLIGLLLATKRLIQPLPTS